MTTIPFRLIFKRSQSTQEHGTPLFHVTALAEMTPEFQQAVDNYGLWAEEIWHDPLLNVEDDEAFLSAADREKKQKRRAASISNWIEGLDPIIILMVFPLWISYKLTKWTIMLPIWLFRMRSRISESHQLQDERVMRFHELKNGKTLTAMSLVDALAIENAIEESATTIAQYVESAVDYSGELVVTDRIG